MGNYLIGIPPNLIDLLNSESDELIARGAGDGDYQIPDGIQVIRQVPPSSGTMKITLPGVQAARNQSILVMSIGNDTGTITVEEQGDGEIAFADVILTADLDYVVIENIGGMFWVARHEVST